MKPSWNKVQFMYTTHLQSEAENEKDEVGIHLFWNNKNRYFMILISYVNNSCIFNCFEYLWY